MALSNEACFFGGLSEGLCFDGLQGLEVCELLACMCGWNGWGGQGMGE